jgi:hypothetical protein
MHLKKLDCAIPQVSSSYVHRAALLLLCDSNVSGELFHDVQPFVRSALDGYNICIFAYGQSCSGKTHTLVLVNSHVL